HYSSNVLERLIDQEIKNQSLGLPSGIQLKMNAITNFKLIDKLYEASAAGVPIKMIVRGICCLIPGMPSLSENIEVISVVDKFLEHPRVYIFEHGGTPKYFISSADFMTRNIENRLEVAAPIYDLELQKQIQDVFSLCWSDNVKARYVNGSKANTFINNKKPKNRSQWSIYEYYKKRYSNA
ncbi:MAG: polyphosphate kinase 1, partial [Flavobacteriaceae bacterium]